MPKTKILILSMVINSIVVFLLAYRAINQEPIYDDIGTLARPYLSVGFNYPAWKQFIFFRPIEYYLYALTAFYRSPGLIIVISFFIVALTASFGAVIVASARPGAPLQSPFPYLAGLLIVVHPVILPPAFRISILSQCLANLFSIILLWILLKKKVNFLLLAIILCLGALAKESFLPLIPLSGLYLFFRDRKPSYISLSVIILTLYLFARSAIVNSPTGLRYSLGIGFNNIKNILFHLVGLSYFGSSPDLFALNLAREIPLIAYTITFWLIALIICLPRGFDRVQKLILMFSFASLFPGILTQAVSEQNVSAFALFTMVYILYALYKAINPITLLSVLIILTILISSSTIVRKTYLLSQTISDYRRMKSQLVLGHQVSCERKFKRPFSFYTMNSSKLLHDIEYTINDGTPRPTCIP